MAVGNSLAQNPIKDKTIEYKAGDETIKLSPTIIRRYLVSGDNEKVTDQEIALFLNLCRYQHLNPFLREAYLVKYGNSPATIVTGKDAFAKRAQRNPGYKGIEAGVVVRKEDGALENRVGSLVLKDEELVGGWARVYINGYNVPTELTVSYDEYVGRKSNGDVNSTWRSKPGTMIRKVAFVQALREAFPDDLEGMYSQEEMNIEAAMLDETPISIESTAEQDYIPEAASGNFAEDDPLA